MSLKERAIDFLEKEIDAAEQKLARWRTELEAIRAHPEILADAPSGDPPPGSTNPPPPKP
jgi:hypothetical protein